MRQVILVQTCYDAGTVLESGLAEAGYTVLETTRSLAQLAQRVNQLRPEIVIVEAEICSDSLLAQLSYVQPGELVPVVVFAHCGTDDCVRRAMQSGVILHVVEDLTPLLLHSLVEVAALFSINQRLIQNELETVQQELADQRCIEQAKCLLMEQQHLTENEAYVRLRTTAMNESRRLADVAKSYIALHKKEASIERRKACN